MNNAQRLGFDQGRISLFEYLSTTNETFVSKWHNQSTIHTETSTVSILFVKRLKEMNPITGGTN